MKFSGLIGVACLLLSSSALAGNLTGPAKTDSALSPGYSESWEVVFTAGPGFVLVNGDGASKLVCSLTDSKGLIVQQTSGRTDSCLLSIFPEHPSKYVLRVMNVGDRADEFTVRTN